MIDKKTGEKSKTRPRFIKQDQIAIARYDLIAAWVSDGWENSTKSPPPIDFVLNDKLCCKLSDYNQPRFCGLGSFLSELIKNSSLNNLAIIRLNHYLEH